MRATSEFNEKTRFLLFESRTLLATFAHGDDKTDPLMTKFLLKCMDWNAAHVSFAIYEGRGLPLNGFVNVDTKDVERFVAENWNGDVDWNGKIPANLPLKLFPK